MPQDHRGWPNILQLVRTTSLWVTGKPGATAGAGLAGGTTSGAPTSGQFAAGEAVVAANGHLWICTASGTPGTWVDAGASGGYTDPLTTRGDLVVRGASSTGRLALGSSGQVLASDGTDAVWAASSSALTQLAVLSGAGATYDFTGISGSYNALRLQGLVRLDAAVADDFALLRVNADSTAAHYASQYCEVHSNLTAAGGTITTAGLWVGDVAGASAPASQYSPLTIDIPLYANTTTYKGVLAANMVQTGSTAATIYLAQFGSVWLSTAAITQLTLLPNSGSWAANSKVYLYGIT